jgi:hypothetical protein
MKPAHEFFARVPETLYPSGASVGGECIFEGKKAAYNRRHGEAAPLSHALLNVTQEVFGNGELGRRNLLEELSRFAYTSESCGTNQTLALPQ